MTEDTPERAKARKRHLLMGVIWVGMGVMLILTGAGILGPHH